MAATRHIYASFVPEGDYPKRDLNPTDDEESVISLSFVLKVRIFMNEMNCHGRARGHLAVRQ